MQCAPSDLRFEGLTLENFKRESEMQMRMTKKFKRNGLSRVPFRGALCCATLLFTAIPTLTAQQASDPLKAGSSSPLRQPVLACGGTG